MVLSIAISAPSILSPPSSTFKIKEGWELVGHNNKFEEFGWYNHVGAKALNDPPIDRIRPLRPRV